MNKMNKTLAAAMSAVLIICTLAGCNTQTTTQVTSETTTASTTSREHKNMLEDVINQTFETTHAWTEPTSEISETEETTTIETLSPVETTTTTETTVNTETSESETEEQSDEVTLSDFEYRDFYIDYDTDPDPDIGITKFLNKNAKVVTIPSEIDGRPVIYLDNVFYENENIEEIILPDTILFIDSYVFKGCTNLKHIKLSANITMLPSFKDCTSLTEIDIPKSVATITEGAFSGCTSLTSVTLPANVETIDNSTFRNCTNLKHIALNNGLKRINRCAFKNCTNLTELTIPDSVINIDKNAFDGCENLTITYKGKQYVFGEFEQLMKDVRSR